LVVVREHAVDHRMVARRDDLTWTGLLACTCGWTALAGPHGDRYVVTDALSAQWGAHERSGGGAVQAGSKAS
jgi:hypothetical protein